MTTDRAALTPIRLRRAFQRLAAGNLFNLGTFLVYDPATDTLSWVGPLTTKGDIFGRTAAGDDRIPVGTDQQVLQADSAEALGVRWANRLLYVNTADSNQVNNPGAGVPADFSLSAVIPAGALNKVGRVLRVSGDFLAGGAPVNTTLIRLKTSGGVTLASTGATTATSGAPVQWAMQHDLVVRTAGAAGVLSVTSRAVQKNGSTLITIPQNITGAIDLTSAVTILYEITFSTAGVPDVATETLLMVEALN